MYVITLEFQKKNVQFVLKIVIWALKAKKWPCRPVLEIFQDMVKSLGKNLSFSSSLVNTGQHRKKLTYLGYYPTVSVPCHSLPVPGINDEISGVYVYQLHLNCCWVHMEYDIYSTAKAHLIPTLKNYFKDLIKCMYGKACGN